MVPSTEEFALNVCALLMAEKLYINQVGATIEYAYEQVVVFNNSCYTNDFGQVRKEMVNFTTSNAEFLVSPTDINV